MYSDQLPNAGFYQNIYLDSTLTYDSLSTFALTNSFGVTYNDFTLSQLIHHRHAHVNTIDSLDYDYGLSLNYYNDKKGLRFNSELYQSDDLNLSLKKEFNLK